METNEVFELSGTFTLNDVLRFQFFHFLRRMWWLVAMFTAILILIVGVALVVSILFHAPEVARATLPVALILLFWLAFVGLMPYLAARRQFKTMIAFGEPVGFRFSSDGVHSVTGYSSGDTSWKAFWKICEAKTFFSLYFGAGSAWLLPKRFFSDVTEQEKWRRLVEAQIHPKTILKPGVVGKLL